MAKLKCEHNKRVMVLNLTSFQHLIPGFPQGVDLPIVSVVHRENGERCMSDTITINGETFEPIDVIDWVFSEDNFLRQISSAETLLRQIFEKTELIKTITE